MREHAGGATPRRPAVIVHTPVVEVDPDAIWDAERLAPSGRRRLEVRAGGRVFEIDLAELVRASEQALETLIGVEVHLARAADGAPFEDDGFLTVHPQFPRAQESVR
jgi:hypothetical protein